MKNIDMSIICLFYKVFIVLKMKVVLINCSRSKTPSKAAQNNGLIALITAQLGVARPDWGPQKKLGKLPRELILSRGSLADDMFSLIVGKKVTGKKETEKRNRKKSYRKKSYRKKK